MLLRGCLVLALILGVYGCSDDSGGGGDVCEQAFNKTKACASKLDCTNVSAANKIACEINKQLYAALPDYAAAIDACKKSGSTACECTGANKTEAEKLMSSELDPETCNVKAAQPDGGADQQVVDQQTATE